MKDKSARGNKTPKNVLGAVKKAIKQALTNGIKASEEGAAFVSKPKTNNGLGN
jgi:hypothetical protein